MDFAKLGLDEYELDRQLSKVKVKLFTTQGAAFLATILSLTEFRWSMELETAATNGHEIIFNPVFWTKMDDDSRMFVLAHELWHIGYDHMGRLSTRDPKLWNIAADHVINLSLLAQGMKINNVPVLADSKYRDMGTEDVYEDLLKQQQKNGGKGKTPEPEGEGAGGLAQDLKPTPSDKQTEVKGKIIRAVQAAKIQSGGNPGSVPGEIDLYLDKFLNPKLPWEVLLRRFFTEQAKEDYSWKRPSRRYDEYLPSLWSEGGLTKINYYLDISGSVSDGDIHRFNSEVASIKREFDPEELVLITFDTKIQNEYTFTQGQPFDGITVTGRGGTCLRPVREHIKRTKPSVAVIFSDLWVEPMKEVGDVPVLWVVVGNQGATVPFGKMVHIDNE